MKKLCAWIRNNVILASIYVVLAVSLIMLAFYFCKFNDGLSTNNGDWASFGSYFGSITGLLAFAGVLYTAWQSDKRANKAEKRTEEAEQKAKEESKLREERDLFFKLLELYQRQVDSISAEVSGVTAFKEYGIMANKYLKLYIALEGLRDGKEGFEGYGVFCRAIQNYFTSNARLRSRQLSECIDNYLEMKYISKMLDYYSEANVYANNLMKSMTIEDIGQRMKIVADIIYKEKGHLLGQYYRTIFYLLNLTSAFMQKTEYYKIFRSQLSRYELLMLLYNVISNQSTTEVKSLYQDCDIFNNINADDVLAYVNRSGEQSEDVSDCIDRLLTL